MYIRYLNVFKQQELHPGLLLMNPKVVQIAQDLIGLKKWRKLEIFHFFRRLYLDRIRVKKASSVIILKGS